MGVKNQRPCLSSDDDNAENSEMLDDKNQTEMKWQIATVIFMVLLTVFDMGSDCRVVVLYFSEQKFLLAALTISILEFSSLVSTIQSILRYKQEVRSRQGHTEQSRRSFYARWLTHKEWYVRWPWRIFISVLHLSTLFSYWNTFWAALRFLGWCHHPKKPSQVNDGNADPAITVEAPESQALMENRTEKQVKQTLLEKARAISLQCQDEKFSECIIESVLQVLLQLTVVIQMAPAVYEHEYLKQCWFQLISIIISLFSIMIGLYNYLDRNTTYTVRGDDGQPIPDNKQKGYFALNYSAHIFIAVPRVLLYSALASKNIYKALIILGLTWLYMTLSYLRKACNRLWGQQCVLNVARGWTYCWVHLSDDEETAPSKGYYLKFYGYYVIEFGFLLMSYVDEILATNAPFFFGTLVFAIVFIFGVGLLLRWCYYWIKRFPPTKSTFANTDNTESTNTGDTMEYQKACSGVSDNISKFEKLSKKSGTSL